MKADPTQQRELLRLAQHDQQRLHLRHTSKNLPERAQAADLEARIAAHDAEHEATHAHAKAAKQAVTALEDEVEQVTARIQRDNERLLAGGLSKDLVALQRDIASLEQRKSDLEDRELEALDVSEQADAAWAAAQAERERLSTELDSVVTAREARIAEAKAAFTAETDARKALAATLASDLVALNDEVAAKQGTGAALVRARRCEGCHMELDAHVVNGLKALAADEVAQCESCDRILVRTEESGLS
ncbi:hypothetical protein JT358_10285 [Micrococcales bacterium 31B]|nr:hypothetical protein [Micrococcales bacterium 31B]